MPGSFHRGLLRVSVALYRLVLRRYPRRVRDRYGGQMVADFRRMMAEGLNARGLWGWLGAWLVVLRDLLRPLPGPVRKGEPRPERAPRARGPGQGGGTDVSWVREIRTAARSLRRAPGFTALIVGVLGVGIALNVSAFSVVRAYLLRPLPYPQPHRLVEVRPATQAVGWRAAGDVFEEAASWSLDGFTLIGDPGPEVVLGARVSPGFFEVFGVSPALGRTFTEEEAGPGGAPVAVISHRLWTERFGRDREVLGRTVRAYSADRQGGVESFEVVGVLPEGFWHMNEYTDLLLPLRRNAPVHAGRLRGDVPPGRGEEILTTRAVEASAEGLPEDFQVRVRSLQEGYTESVRPRILVFQAAALLVLLVACVNAGLLILVRAVGRDREMGIRRALGAGRRHLATSLLAEGWILALLAGGLGTGLGRLGLDLVGGSLEARLGRMVPGGTQALQLDGTALALALGLSLGIGTVFGLFPLWTTARRSLSHLLGAGGRGGTDSSGPRRLRSGLVAAEVALSLTLLTGGALMVRSALALERMELGFRSEGLVAYTVGLTLDEGEGEERRAAFFRELVDRVSAHPSVEGAAVARAAPFSISLTGRTVEVEGAEGPRTVPEVVPQAASPGYFDLLALSPEAGRWYTSDDVAGTEPVAVVSRSLADAGWDGRGVVGSRVRFPAWRMPEMEEEPGPWFRVVGVAPDVRNGVDAPSAVVYLPHAQALNAWMELMVRLRPGSPPPTEAVRTALKELDPEVPIYATTVIDEAVNRARAPSRFFSLLLGGFSLFSLVLALAGLYGVAAYAARQRRKDVAIRIALGAARRKVERQFLKEASLTLGVGILAGLAGGRLLGDALSGQLQGPVGGQTLTALLVAAFLAGTALLAVWLPAREAAGLDPMEVLREE